MISPVMSSPRKWRVVTAIFRKGLMVRRAPLGELAWCHAESVFEYPREMKRVIKTDVLRGLLHAEGGALEQNGGVVSLQAG